MSDTKTGRKPTEEHLKALAEGREQSRVVRSYLEAIQATKRGRGRPMTADSVQEQLTKVEEKLKGASPIERLHLLQRRHDLSEQLSTLQEVPDVSALEEEFLKIVADYSGRKGISYATWREAGVDARVLKEAGITRTRFNGVAA